MCSAKIFCVWSLLHALHEGGAESLQESLGEREQTVGRMPIALSSLFLHCKDEAGLTV